MFGCQRQGTGFRGNLAPTSPPTRPFLGNQATEERPSQTDFQNSSQLTSVSRHFLSLAIRHKAKEQKNYSGRERRFSNEPNPHLHTFQETGSHTPNSPLHAPNALAESVHSAKEHASEHHPKRSQADPSAAKELVRGDSVQRRRESSGGKKGRERRGGRG